MKRQKFTSGSEMSRSNGKKSFRGIAKSPTGIQGLDEITFGGLPRGRTTLICGSAGCGKTTLSTEFLIRGALQYNEPGVFIAFEETAEELTKNVASLGFDIDDLIKRQKLVVDYVHLERSEIEETGEYDLEGLFLRLGHAINSIGAKRVVLDTIEAIFSAFTNTFVLRAELRRLFRWLKDKGVTVIITGERGAGTLTRHGLEEYVSDCVILLDHRVIDQISTRRMRIIKYRGSSHGTNEYPFLIDSAGVSVLPITSLGLNHEVTSGRVSTGIAGLDSMLGGKGYYRGSSVLISGTAGTGKTSVCAHFIDAACRRRERCLYIASEESPKQVARNMRSIGIDLNPWVEKGLLRFHAVRSTFFSLEMHLAVLHKTIEEYKPHTVVMDPITTFLSEGGKNEVKSMLTRLIDLLKMRQTTGLFTSLTSGANHNLEQSEVGISSIMDTWLFLRDIEVNGERNRGLYVLKSRGMAHSNQIREFLLTDHGIELVDVYVGPGGVLTGTARRALEAEEKASVVKRQQEAERKRRSLMMRRKGLEAKIATLRAEFEAEKQEVEKSLSEDERVEQMLTDNRTTMARLRKAEIAPNGRRTA
ncbi:MAG TPA: circadian clock protein KaiC [Candidatus Udaeobacter sp.]|nr:circadian clock protein KaiC [Candidatus Udaeobacter sp.]